MIPGMEDTDGCDILSDAVVHQVIEIVGDTGPVTSDERRSRNRYPIYCCMRMTPVGRDGSLQAHDTITVVGKDISTNGISFSHEAALPNKQLVISLELAEIGDFGVEAEVLWSRQSLIGLYESGCRLIRKVTPQQS